jgi:hypothetical protein
MVIDTTTCTVHGCKSSGLKPGNPGSLDWDMMS